MKLIISLGLAILMLVGNSLSAVAKVHPYTLKSSQSERSCLKPSAKKLLSSIEARFGKLKIISTCRRGAVIATTGRPSKHRYGLAIDFKPIRASKREVVAWLIKNHHKGGTMTYRDMNHIHVDIGPHFVILNSWSGHSHKRYAKYSKKRKYRFASM